MTTFMLRDVNPRAITICKQGANRQRIFLRKEDTGDGAHQLPGPGRIMKNADWSAFYCVVAAPGAEENPGLIGEPGSVDVWESADEIRKAAHRLMKNQGYVNSVHDQLAEQGCTIVENAVALADFDVLDPTGTPQRILKDSWYVAIEPSDDFKQQVDAGQITGVSLEGDGVRVRKAASYDGAKKCPGCESKVATDAGSCKNCGHTFVKKESLLHKIAAARGVAADDDGLPAEPGTVRKNHTPEDDDVTTDELKAVLAEEREAQTGAIQKSLEDGMVGLVDKLVDKLTERRDAENGGSGSGGSGGDGGGGRQETQRTDEPSAGDLKKSLDDLSTGLADFAGKLDGVEASVAALAAGESSQQGEPDQVRKAETAWHQGIL